MTILLLVLKLNFGYSSTINRMNCNPQVRRAAWILSLWLFMAITSILDTFKLIIAKFLLGKWILIFRPVVSVQLSILIYFITILLSLLSKKTLCILWMLTKCSCHVFTQNAVQYSGSLVISQYFTVIDNNNNDI